MKAIQMLKQGGPEVLEYKDIKIGKPIKGQALVGIKAAGINFIDIYQRNGTYPVKLPYIPGLEGSGIVEAIADDVTCLKVGDRVAYVHQPGSYAELAHVDANFLIPLPKELSFEQGAAFPLQGMTAHYLLHEFRKIKPTDVVLIHAAAGGMGLLLVQWAKHLGARVIGTVSTEEKAKIAKAAGADEIILYTTQDFVAETKKLTNDHGADLIIDGVGKTTFEKDFEACASRGNIVIYGAASGPVDTAPLAIMKKNSLTLSSGILFNYILTPEELKYRANAVLEGIKQGWLNLKIDEVFALEKASDAQIKLESRKTSGKLLLKP